MATDIKYKGYGLPDSTLQLIASLKNAALPYKEFQQKQDADLAPGTLKSQTLIDSLRRATGAGPVNPGITMLPNAANGKQLKTRDYKDQIFDPKVLTLAKGDVLTKPKVEEEVVVPFVQPVYQDDVLDFNNWDEDVDDDEDVVADDGTTDDIQSVIDGLTVADDGTTDGVNDIIDGLDAVVDGTDRKDVSYWVDGVAGTSANDVVADDGTTDGVNDIIESFGEDSWAGSGSGGGEGGGGGCPAPWIQITLAGGGTVQAGEIKTGMLVFTRHEEKDEWGNFPVTDVSMGTDERWKIRFAGGLEFVGTFNHRVLTDKDWTEIRHLKAGDKIVRQVGYEVVEEVSHFDHGPIVKITVEDAHTYLTQGFLSHNIKSNNPDSYGYDSFDDFGFNKGGPVTADRLIGPDPAGPDDGFGALKTGEFVLTKEAAKQIGYELLKRLNRHAR